MDNLTVSEMVDEMVRKILVVVTETDLESESGFDLADWMEVKRAFQLAFWTAVCKVV